MSTAVIQLNDVNGVTVLDTSSQTQSVISVSLYTTGTMVIPFDPLFTNVTVVFQPLAPVETYVITNVPSRVFDYNAHTVTLAGGTAGTLTVILLGS